MQSLSDPTDVLIRNCTFENVSQSWSSAFTIFANPLFSLRVEDSALTGSILSFYCLGTHVIRNTIFRDTSVAIRYNSQTGNGTLLLDGVTFSNIYKDFAYPLISSMMSTILNNVTYSSGNATFIAFSKSILDIKASRSLCFTK